MGNGNLDPMPQNSTPTPVQMSSFAHDVMTDRYSHTLPDGRKETWEEIAWRVARNVLGAVDAPEAQIRETAEAIIARKWMPAGRYLRSSGLDYHQVNNCLLLRATDTREGWGDLTRKAAIAQMTGAGIGVDYSDLREKDAVLTRSGGTSSGPLALMHMINEIGRGARQGGTRRGAIWAGLNWRHPDIFDFIRCKDWTPDIKALKAKDFNAVAPYDYTNISVLLDDEFFAAYSDGTNPLHLLAGRVYWEVIAHMLRTGEPGFSVDVGPNRGETLRNAPVCAETRVLTRDGYKTVGDIVGTPTSLWTGVRWADDCVFEKTGDMVPTVRVMMSNGRSIRCDPGHEFLTGIDPTHDGAVMRELPRFGDQHTLYRWISQRVPAKKLVSHQLGRSLPHITLTGNTFVELGLNDDRPEVQTFEPDDSLIYVKSVTDDGPADVFCCDVRYPEHSFMAEGVLVSNCTEITSADDSDVCNLGSINVSRVDSPDEMEYLVRIGIRFLLAGTIYSDLPYAEVHETRSKNRRLGLGLMGVAEWLTTHRKPYGPDAELEILLKIYAGSGPVADELADGYGISRPVKTRAIAPVGTISIIAETTSGGEPVFCAAFLRRWRIGEDWQEEYVVDPVALRLLESGVNPDIIEDAYSLAPDIERRFAFQTWLQQFVDHGISSTVNLPAWGSEHNNETGVKSFGDTLMKYLPDVRGITVYPDGSRNGQPLNAIPLETALRATGREDLVMEQGDVCDIRSGESCGS
jgi:ribonucleotide reductase alpha subunit